MRCSLLFPVVLFDSDCLPFFHRAIGSLGACASVTCHPGCHPMRWQGRPTHLPHAHTHLCACLYFLWTLVCSLAPSPELPRAHLTHFVVYWWGITVPLCPDWFASVCWLGRRSDFCPTFLVTDLHSAYLLVRLLRHWLVVCRYHSLVGVLLLGVSAYRRASGASMSCSRMCCSTPHA